MQIVSQLKNYIQSRTNISDEDLNEIFLLCSVHDYKKDDVIIKHGGLCRVIGFLNKGLIRVTSIKLDKEFTAQFIFEGCFFSYVPGLTEKKCDEDFIALEDCEVVLLDKNILRQILEKDQRLNKLFTLKLAQELKNLLFQNQQYRSTSPTERYLHFVEQNHEVYNRILLQYIAAYLGLEPRSLSRIRNRLSKKH